MTTFNKIKNKIGLDAFNQAVKDDYIQQYRVEVEKLIEKVKNLYNLKVTDNATIQKINIIRDKCSRQQETLQEEYFLKRLELWKNALLDEAKAIEGKDTSVKFGKIKLNGHK